MHQVQIYDDIYQLPATWDELSNQELAYLVKLTQKDVSLEQVKIYMLLYCLKARVTRHRKIYGNQVHLSVGKESENVRFRVRRKKYLLTPEEVNSLANIFEFLFERETDKYSRTMNYYIKPDCFANPYPALRIRMRKFIGPDDGLYDITFEQFIYMQTYRDAMRQDPQKNQSSVGLPLAPWKDIRHQPPGQRRCIAPSFAGYTENNHVLVYHRLYDQFRLSFSARLLRPGRKHQEQCL